MKWIMRLYIFFVGIILTTTTGFGIAAFYPQPTAPTYPITSPRVVVPQSCYATPQQQHTPECQKAYATQADEQTALAQKQAEYDKQMAVFKNVNAGYTRTAIFLGIAIGALFAIIGLTLIGLSHPVANGVMLAGVLTAISTRIIIMLASMGSSVTGTNGADTLAYVEFGILVALSLAVIILGFTTLKSFEGKK